MDWKRVVLALCLWLSAAGAIALVAHWIASSAYGSDRLAMLVNDPRLMTGVGFEYWVLCLGVIGLIAAGAVLLAPARRSNGNLAKPR